MKPPLFYSVVVIVDVGCSTTSFISRFTSITKVACPSFSSTFHYDKLLSKLPLNKLSEFSLHKLLSEASLVFNENVCVDFSKFKDTLFYGQLANSWLRIKLPCFHFCYYNYHNTLHKSELKGTTN